MYCRHLTLGYLNLTTPRAAENVFSQIVPLGDARKRRATQIAEVIRFEKIIVFRA
jgi:hypothetical protein